MDTSPDRGRAYVFLSYASSDRERVLEITGQLRSRDVPVWIDVSDITGGVSYGPEIAAGIRDSGALVLACSHKSLASRNVRQEIQLAWRYERPILPLLLEPLSFPDDLAYWLEGAQWIEAFTDADRWLERLINALALHGFRNASVAPSAALTTSAPEQPAPPGNLPAATVLVGRDRDVAQLLARLKNGRLVTITGPGGAGKTSLALEAAHRTANAYAGVWFVDAADARAADDLVAVIEAAIGAEETAGDGPIDAIVRRLGTEPVLVLLDNLEQVADAASPIRTLLDRMPNLRVLCTSRSPLRVSGELLLMLSGLASPDPDTPATIAELARYPAVEVFLGAARRARPNFTLTDGNAAAIAAICARLDGLPLAIELAAARSRLLPPQAILERLEQSIDLLSRGTDALSERQRTLRGTISWSYDLLNPSEQAVFRTLSVFGGSGTVSAVEAVCDGPDVLDALEALIDQSLVQAVDGAGDDEPRLRMLETIRQFGLEELRLHGEETDARDRHAAHFLRVAEDARAPIEQASDPAVLAAIERDEANLRLALQHLAGAEARSGDARELRLAVALWRFWWIRGRLREALTRLEQAIARNPSAPDDLLARALIATAAVAEMTGALHHAGALADRAIAVSGTAGDQRLLAHALDGRGTAAEAQGDYQTAASCYERALEQYRQADDERGTAVALHRLGSLATMTGDYDRAAGYVTAALEIWRRRGELQNIAYEVQQLGILTFLRGDYATAAEMYEETVSLAESLGDQMGIGNGLLNLGSALEMAGDLDSAREHLTRARQIFDEIGDLGGVGYVTYLLGHVARLRGTAREAETTLREAFATLQQVGDRPTLALVLETLAGTALDAGDGLRAARLFGAAEALREETGAALPASRATEMERDRETLRSSLPAADLEAALADGRSRPPAELIGEP